MKKLVSRNFCSQIMIAKLFRIFQTMWKSTIWKSKNIVKNDAEKAVCNIFVNNRFILLDFSENQQAFYGTGYSVESTEIYSHLFWQKVRVSNFSTKLSKEVTTDFTKNLKWLILLIRIEQQGMQCNT